MSDDEMQMEPVQPRRKPIRDESNLPWVEKYRPTDLDAVISHRSIITTLQSLIAANRLPHLLLYGPPGTGKTSTILAIARTMFGRHYSSHILELNASDERGIDVVRDQIKDFASSRQLFSNVGFKMIVLDEADSMTKPAQFALRRIIEKYTRNTRFCLICNYVNKIIPALQSRCTRFRFGPLEPAQMSTRLKEIAVIEKVDLTPEACEAIVALSLGDMRRTLNILQQTSAALGSAVPVTEDAVYQVTGQPHPKYMTEILQHLLNNTIAETYQFISHLQTEQGLALVDIVTHIHPLVMSVDFPSPVHMYILSELSDVEYRLSSGTNEKIQLAGLISIFMIARCKLAQIKRQV